MDHKELRERHDELKNDNQHLEKISSIQDKLINEVKDISRIKTDMIDITEKRLKLTEDLHQMIKDQIRDVITNHKNGDGTSEAWVINEVLNIIS